MIFLCASARIDYRRRDLGGCTLPSKLAALWWVNTGIPESGAFPPLGYWTWAEPSWVQQVPFHTNRKTAKVPNRMPNRAHREGPPSGPKSPKTEPSNRCVTLGAARKFDPKVARKKASARRHDGILRFLAAPDPGWWYWWPWSNFFSSKNSRILGGSLKFETQCFWWKFPVVRNPVWPAAANFTSCFFRQISSRPSQAYPTCAGKFFPKNVTFPLCQKYSKS